MAKSTHVVPNSDKESGEEKVLFARVGHMKFYEGPQKGDEKPIEGGKFNNNEIGYEAYNFKEVDGKLYGYFQPHMKKPYRINLKRIDPASTKDDVDVDDVLVIFFSPSDKGQVIIGWYRDATVHKNIEYLDNQEERDNFGYYLVANKKDSVLLPINKRRYTIGHGMKGIKKGNPGEANVFYLYDPKFKKKESNKFNSWIYDAIKYIKDYEGEKIDSFEDKVLEELDNSTINSGQGFQSNIIKRMIENHAMDMCKKHFTEKGYKLEDTSLNKPYDFIAKKENKELFIEVKGTRATGDKIILTKNEVKMSKNHGKKMVLFLVHSIKLNKKSTKRNSGTIVIKSPWIIDRKKLTPISYTYTVS